MNSNTRKIFIISIIVICVIAIVLAICFLIPKKPNEESNEDEIIIDTAMLTENFNDIFDNQINYQNNIINIQKEDYTKELIYTSYTKKETVENLYQLNVNIPYININTDTVKAINNEINSLFYNRVTSILGKTDNNTVYDVKYKAYLNDNILSLIISATLKDEDNAGRVIIKTYNYNISSDSKLGIQEVLQYRKISEEYAQNKINETIKVASENVNKYNELSNSKYLRNVNDSMYKIENTIVYFIGENKAIYIIYPYGNLNYTSEVDLLVM